MLKPQDNYINKLLLSKGQYPICVRKVTHSYKFIYILSYCSAVQTKGLVTFVCIVAIIAIPLLTTTNSSNNSNYNNQLFLQQAFATHMSTATTSNKTTVVHQGIIASVPSPEIKLQPNEQSQTVIVLPYRNDGSIYKRLIQQAGQ